MLRKKFAYIFVEVGKREFESRLLVKNELEKRGFTVIIGLKDLLLDLLVFRAFPPGIIFDKCAQMAVNWRIKTLKKRGFKYTCLDEEGIFSNVPEVAIRNPDHENCDFIFLNNKVHFKLLEKANPKNYSKDKLLISGNPRQSKFFQNTDENLINNECDILIIGNFVHLRHGGKFRVNHRDPSLIFNYDKQSHEIVKALVKVKGINLGYRPHPSETDWYKQLKNIKILNDKNIYYWLNRYKNIVCFRCTTSLEARAMGKKVYTFSNNSSVAPILNGVGVKFKSVDQLINIIKSNKYNIHAPKREKFILGSYIPEERPEKIISQKLDSINIKAFNPNKSFFYSKIISKFLWFYYRRFNRDVILQKFNTSDIKKHLQNRNLKKISKFIYN